MTFDQLNIHNLPGKTDSLWLATSTQKSFPSQQQDVSVDVAVIGGGIVGVTSAYLLKKAGLRVALVDARRILGGVTGHTTAKLTSQHGLIYNELISNLGKEKAKQYADANQSAIEKVAFLIKENNIDCDFIRKPAYTFAFNEQSIESIKNEAKSAVALGLPATYLGTLDMPFEVKGAVCFANQAQFHPVKYLQGLLEKVEGDGCYIFENTMALDIIEEETCKVKTDKGIISARNVIVATHYPFYEQTGFYYVRLYQSRSYVIAFTSNKKLENGMFISVEEPTRSLRSQPYGDKELIILTGNDHRTGDIEKDTLDYYSQLKEFAEKYFGINSIEYSWSTQDVMTLDHVPYIGKIGSGMNNTYVATGFEKWGMTNGTAASVILSDLILKRNNPWTEVFDPLRFKPTVSVKELVSQGTLIDKEMQAKRLNPKGIPLQELNVDQGELIKINNEKAIAYKDKQGKIYALYPYCTHMGCQLSWNHAERTWDCPCHGSRFSIYGKVIQEPAMKTLEKKSM